MPTSVINRRLSLDQGRIQRFIFGHILGFKRIQNLFGVDFEIACDVLYDIIFLDPVMSSHFSQFKTDVVTPKGQDFTLSRVVGSLPFIYGEMFDTTHNQINNWRWDNTHTLRDHVDRSNQQTLSLGNVECTGEHVSWYSSDDLLAKIEPPRC